MTKSRLNGKKIAKGARVAKNQFVTKSGNRIKLHRSIGVRLKAHREAQAIRKAERLKRMPKGRLQRFLYRINPRNAARYWFSKEGAIMALKLTGIGMVAGFFILAGLFAYIRKDLPDLRRDISGNNIGGSIRYYDRTGDTLLWEDYDAVKRIPVKDTEISQAMKDATVAVEDRDFYKHSGFNVRAIGRAAWNNAFGGSTQGGSTITQQLVKLTQDWTTDRSYTRKIKEVILSVELERTYTKQEILTGYLNAAPYNGIDYGVEAASRSYFQKSAKDLTLEEAVMLAAIPKSPTYYSPYSQDFDKEAFVGRTQYILDVMHDMGSITKEQRDAAKNVDIVAQVKPRAPKYDGIKAPYFVLAAKESLERNTITETLNRVGWKVTTTIDLGLQNIAEEEVKKGMAQITRQKGNKAAFVAEDVRTGQVVAMVGGADFGDKERAGELNYATQFLPPGSSFKPYDYASLIEHTENAGAGSVLYDSQGPLEGYPCTNKARPPTGNCLYDFDFRYPGAMTLRYALGGSRNVPAVKAMLIAGIDKTIQTAEKLGLRSGYNCYESGKKVGVVENETQCYSSSAIGDGAYLRLDEHVHAYSSLSRNGVNIPQTYILKIEDADGRVVSKWEQEQGEQAIRAESAYIVADMMSDPKASYLSRKIHTYKNHRFSIKTGTTNDSKDGWMMGFSTYYSAGVWVGHHTGNIEMTGFMENMTQPIWNGFMTRAHESLQPIERVKPGGIQTLPAFVVRSHVGNGSVEPSVSNDLFPPWYKAKQKSNQKQTIDIVSNKLATECTPERAKKEVTETTADSFSADPFNGTGASTDQKDDIHKCDDVKPSVSLSVSGSGGSYTLTATVSQGTHALSSSTYPGTVNFSIDGQILPGGSFTINSPGSVTFNYESTHNGDKAITAEIIDSVLYSATDAKTVNLQNSSSGNSNNVSITAPSDGGTVTGLSTSVVWTAGNGNFKVSVDAPGNGSSFTSLGNTTSKNYTVPKSGGNGQYRVRVEDETTGKSDTVTFTWN